MRSSRLRRYAGDRQSGTRCWPRSPGAAGAVRTGRDTHGQSEMSDAVDLAPGECQRSQPVQGLARSGWGCQPAAPGVDPSVRHSPSHELTVKAAMLLAGREGIGTAQPTYPFSPQLPSSRAPRWRSRALAPLPRWPSCRRGPVTDLVVASNQKSAPRSPMTRCTQTPSTCRSSSQRSSRPCEHLTSLAPIGPGVVVDPEEQMPSPVARVMVVLTIM